MSSGGHTPGGLHERIAAALDGDTQRYTQGRMRLVDALAAAKAPTTLPALLASDPDLSQSSCYRNLVALERCGVVRRIVGPGDHAHYELAEPFVDHHHHLICKSCGSVEDVHLGPEAETAIHQVLAAANPRDDFTIDPHAVDFHGTCAGCAAPNAAPLAK